MSAPAKWHEGAAVGFDLEATGTSPLDDHIVTATVVYTIPGTRPRSVNWLIDPGTPIPDEAAQVHGWTTSRLRERLGGREAAKIVNGHQRWLTRAGALREIRDHLSATMAQQVPLAVMNASYDLTMIEAELRRHDHRNLAAIVPGGITGIVDPAVLDKQWDQFRKACYKAPGCNAEEKHHECGGCRGGKYDCGGCGSTDRTLGSLCAHYGVVLANAHSSDADALAAVRLAHRLAGLWPDIARLKLSTLHDKQVEWRRTQSEGLREFFTRIGAHDKAAEVCPEWPVHKACVTRRTAVQA